MKEKYKWSEATIDNIECEIHSNFIQNQTYVRKKIITKFIHRWLLSGSKNFEQEIGCSYCEIKRETTDNDHFLTCELSFEKENTA